MRKILITLGLIIPSLSAFCQQDSLLKTFKYRIKTYRALSFNAGTNNQFKKEEPGYGTHKENYTAANIEANCFTVKSTDDIFFTTVTSLGSNYASYRSESSTNFAKTKSFQFLPGVSVLNKWFSKKFFTELGAGVFGNYRTTKDKLSNASLSSKDNFDYYNIAINTGIGKGRLEIITDMQTALWLNKALTEAGSLSRALTAEELNNLGRSITKGNSVRVLDSRRRTQFILKTVDDYLQQQGLINKSDITYFSNLNDILFFAIDNPRTAGTEKFIRFTPSVSFNNSKSYSGNDVEKFKHRFNTQSFALTSGISRYIPASLKHQNDYGASLKLSYTHTDLSDQYLDNGTVTYEIKGKPEVKQAGIYAFYDHQIYPNTRTSISLGARGEAGYQNVPEKNSFYTNAFIFSDLNYFISYRTRFICNLALEYYQNNFSIYDYIDVRPNGIQLFVNAGITVNL
ncbi:hypothetical protein BH11BAC3_BH11BAC3_44720 [soil metagenome]